MEALCFQTAYLGTYLPSRSGFHIAEPWPMGLLPISQTQPTFLLAWKSLSRDIRLGRTSNPHQVRTPFFHPTDCVLLAPWRLRCRPNDIKPSESRRPPSAPTALRYGDAIPADMHGLHHVHRGAPLVRLSNRSGGRDMAAYTAMRLPHSRPRRSPGYLEPMGEHLLAVSMVHRDQYWDGASTSSIVGGCLHDQEEFGTGCLARTLQSIWSLIATQGTIKMGRSSP
ncbi:hypothetical protein QBC39DRAFT_116451 [Podospora conica]|nr:hypothetical protein QBC39DRAFT_116451 [Schizothecium conicum]